MEKCNAILAAESLAGFKYISVDAEQQAAGPMEAASPDNLYLTSDNVIEKVVACEAAAAAEAKDSEAQISTADRFVCDECQKAIFLRTFFFKPSQKTARVLMSHD